MTNLFSVKDKCIVITGGAGILCGALAEDLARSGAKVCIADYDEFRANQLAEKINAAGGFALAVRINVLEKKEVEEAFACALESLGRIDALINGAGGNKKEATTSDQLAFFDIPADAFRWVFDLNCLGTILPCQVFGRYMAKQKEGVILNISSMNAFRPLTKISAYSAAKAAVSNFTQWLAVHMCQNYSTSIRVNAIAPGFFLTEQNRFLLTDEKTGELTPRGRTIIGHTPMGRFGQPEELCGTVRWLLSDASKFVTGTVIPVDGGFSAFSGV
ncbi:MAG TPA: SDR family oxidoreductase [Anaerohalosphaeraceae bacterium]|nr:SDR family oxidoreductase [Anaerohalosphaeraceae bacterium]HOL31757.1 SDR family oxidoreductase [Anaerohalosphaeraceae bacterium]HOM75000.1 SDR family oxidoreductase [Anaerohalosphaeraceae bacterium]HPC63251.1 SDR family oxidoreductase [Anaerohalosphaeraceae bacterium]HPO69553.1 SDR family oxidoreductase [Anaerohalosphaeraceae bacterium]